MLTIRLDGLDEARRALREMSPRRLDAAAATALTRSARALGEAWRKEMTEDLDRPTPFTLRSVRTKQATAAQPVATVQIPRGEGAGGSISPGEYMATHDIGGRRRVRKFEQALQAQGSMPRGWFVVPGQYAKLDGYGNISRGQIVQVIAQLGAAFSPGYQRVISKSAARRAATAIKRGRNYVAVLEKRGQLYPGVYQAQGRRLLPVFLYKRAVTYRKRTDLIGTARKLAPAIVQREMRRSLREHFARLAARAVGAPS